MSPGSEKQSVDRTYCYTVQKPSNFGKYDLNFFEVLDVTEDSKELFQNMGCIYQYLM